MAAKEKRWGVVCRNYVSLHPDKETALRHASKMAEINFGFCKAQHTVELTDLRAGSRYTGQATP